MGLKVGEFFVELGIVGADKTIGAVSTTLKGMGDLTNASWEAKAAILAAFYALEQLFAKSGAMGTSLTNANSLLGVNTKTLQQYQYAARQAGIANEAVIQTLNGIQQAMTNTLFSGKAPEGLARFAQLTGFTSPEVLKMLMENPQKLIQAAQVYAQRETEPGLRNKVLASLGFAPDFISGIVRQKFTPDILNKAPLYSDKEVAALDRANIAWSNLFNHIEMAVGHRNAAEGERLVGEITKVADALLRLSSAVIALAEHIHFFDALTEIFNGWAKLFDAMHGKMSVASGMTSTEIEQAKKNASPMGVGKGHSVAAALVGLPGANPGFDSMMDKVGDLVAFTTEAFVTGANQNEMRKRGLGGGSSVRIDKQELNFTGDPKDPSVVAGAHKDAAVQAHKAAMQGQTSVQVNN
jgi:hypothetical protein